MKIIFLMLAVISFAACTTVDPYTGESKTSNTTTGAVVGAVAGAVVGAASASDKDRKKGAATGAVVGGAIGGGVGYYMDQQEAALREKLRGSGVQVKREGDTIQLIMPGNITFATSKYEIRSDFYSVLDSVSLVLIEFDKTAIKVSGHTDSTGSAEFNQTLSEQRAESVRSYLINKKIKAGRLQAIGYGPRYPIATNNTAEGRQINRRVELELLPL